MKLNRTNKDTEFYQFTSFEICPYDDKYWMLYGKPKHDGCFIELHKFDNAEEGGKAFTEAMILFWLVVI